MSRPTEILVHVSGPSRGADDARYRKEALGFQHFALVEKHMLLEKGSKEQGPVGQLDTTNKGAPAANDDARKTLPEQEQEHAISPVRRLPHELDTTEQTNRMQQLTTPATSKPTDPAFLWTTIKQTPHLQIERTPAIPRPRTAPTASIPTQAPPSRRSQSDSWQTPPSVVPDSQPPPPSSDRHEISSSPYLKRPFASSSPSPAHPSSSPTAKRPCIQVSSSPVSESLAIEPSRPAEPAPPSSSSEPLQISSSPPSSPPRIVEIHPPRPKPSKALFSTHLTTSLTLLTDRLPLAKYFTPLTQTRKLEVLERGHWYVPTSTWSKELMTKCWDFLISFVGEGRAGWGVWCVREMEALRYGEGSDKENDTPKEQEGVKVYCWGEVVGEVWVVLFLASERRIKGVGARWMDAGGEAVVVMK